MDKRSADLLPIRVEPMTPPGSDHEGICVDGAA